MPVSNRFGGPHLEWQVCVLRIAQSLLKQYLVGLRGVSSQDIGLVNFNATF
jgi:hypothetical protein